MGRVEDTEPYLSELLPFVDAVVFVDTREAGVLQNKQKYDTSIRVHGKKVK